MRYCPNKGCPHRRVTGKAAEFVDELESCAECGAKLVSQSPSSATTTVTTASPLPNSLRSRLFVTGATLLGLGVLQLIPSPFVQMELLSGRLGVSGVQSALSFGPLSLGLTPFIIAFVLVEIVVLIFRNNLRHGNPGARRRMTQTALGLGFAVCVVQSYGQALWLESATYSMHPDLLLPGPGWAFRILFTLTLLAGSALWLGGALLISQRGVGNGFALLFLFSLAPAFLAALQNLWSQVALDAIAPLGLLLLLVAVLALTYGVTQFFLRLGAGNTGSTPIAHPTCGTTPIELGVSLVLLPATLNNLFQLPLLESLTEALYPGGGLALAVELAVVVISTPIVSALFYRRHITQLQSAAVVPEWRRAQVVSGAFLGACLLAFALVTHLLGTTASTALPSVLTMIVVVVISLDLRDELRLRRTAPSEHDLLLLEEHQDLFDALEARAEYKESGREVFIQGLYFRSMTYFFGPYVPLKIYGHREPERPSEVVVNPPQSATDKP